mgnify:CR=1 FL=1
MLGHFRRSDTRDIMTCYAFHAILSTRDEVYLWCSHGRGCQIKSYASSDMHLCITAQSHMHHCITAQSQMHHCIAAQSHIASEEKIKHPNYYACSSHCRASLTNVGRITAPKYNLLSYHTYSVHVNNAIHKNNECVSEQNNNKLINISIHLKTKQILIVKYLKKLINT